MDGSATPRRALRDQLGLNEEGANISDLTAREERRRQVSFIFFGSVINCNL